MADKYSVARSLRELADYLEISDTNRFKALAYRNAARRVEGLRDLERLVESNEILGTPGVGKTIAPVIAELTTTGRSRYLDELRSKYPAGIFELLRIPGLTLKRIAILHEKLGVATVDDLEQACESDRLLGIRGMGAKTQTKILEGIEFFRNHSEQYLLPHAIEAAELLAHQIRGISGVRRVEITGSIRRRLETATNINLCVELDDRNDFALRLSRLEGIEEITEKEPAALQARVKNGLPAKLHLCSEGQWGAALLWSTGSPDFVASMVSAAERKNLVLSPLSLERDGHVLPAESEEDLFRHLGVAWAEPEIREQPISRTRSRPLPLISFGQLRGTFHAHTTYSDGRNSVNEMLGAAAERGFEYLGISDHSKAAGYAGGLTEDRLRLQQAEIDKQGRSFPSLLAFKGTEADILADGQIDYDASTLATFDFVIASVHSHFKMDRDAMTRRILRALDNPFVTFLGHLTGRLLLSRAGYTMDFDRVFEKAANQFVMIEINGNPHRLDIDWRLMRRALDRGVTFSIHPDAHSTDSLSHVGSGVWAARKGGVPPERVFNTRGADEVREFLSARRARAMGLR